MFAIASTITSSFCYYCTIRPLTTALVPHYLVGIYHFVTLSMIKG
jgi:hypothetical protein